MRAWQDFQTALARRAFLQGAGAVTGWAALTGIWPGAGRSADAAESQRFGGLATTPHFTPRAKHVIYLFQSGGPSHLELFDYKPKLVELHGSELPDSIRQGQRLTGMTSGQTSFPVACSGGHTITTLSFCICIVNAPFL